MYRTHIIKEITKELIGKEVQLAGFVRVKRDLGGFVFIELKDHDGMMQLNTQDETLINIIKDIPLESCISVKGILQKRPEDNINELRETGDLEVILSEIEVLNKVKNVLPFEIERSHETREDLRLEYRFLDLRNDNIHKKIVFRSEVLKFLRDKMTSLGFVEIQTPILTSSSPEGARDYIIPSRIHKGEFYALPQAPQQFKQLLMISNFDKYYQIAPCFRDEDPRADRLPGEFYQLDFEMAFATEEEVHEVLQEVVSDLFTKKGLTSISKDSFKKIKYIDAMNKYGSDKPDLRNPLVLTDLSDAFENTDFNVFKGKKIKAIAFDSSKVTRKFFDEMVVYSKEILGLPGLAFIKVNEDMTISGSISKFITSEVKEKLTEKGIYYKNVGIVFLADTDLLKVCKDAGNIRNELGSRLDIIDKSEYKFCFIVDFPFYELNDEGKIEFSHNPFSMPIGGMDSLMNKNPLDIEAYQYDLVCNGYEIASGAVRNHDTEVMVKAFEIAGYSESEVENRFGSLYNAFKYGAPPHAGAAPGIDRLIMLLLGENNVREVTAFPKNSKARDALMKAPNFVMDSQLKEVHIKIDNDKK